VGAARRGRRRAARPAELEEARDHVGRRLPRSHAPRELRVVDALPLLPSGKIDRMGLRG
jgi:O-succinylbenzoic acid--CoA ligase